MAITAKNSGGSNLEPIKPGTHLAICVQMIHIGTIEEDYQGDIKKQNKVRITWELPKITHEFNEGEPEPRLVSKEFTLSMNPKASLRKFLDSWRGTPFTAEEAEAFDVTKLLGVPCMLSIGEKVSQASKKKYNTVDTAVALPEGIDAPEQFKESSEVNYDNLHETFDQVPNFIKEKMKTSEEYANSDFEFPEEESEEQDEQAEEKPKKATKKKMPF